MKRNPFLFFLAVVISVSMACSLKFDLPIDEITTGETVTEPIKVDLPDGTAEVSITFGAGELKISPGLVPGMIMGTAKYNVADLKPVIEIDEQKVNISTGNFEITGIPNIDEDIENIWELEIGSSPVELKIKAGAYKGVYDFGGLAITSLEITDGASDAELAFSTPNKLEMDTLRYVTGASNLEMRGLANANFESMTFRGGAGDFKLDFSGLLKRDATVQIESGLSHVEVVIPETTSARVLFRGGLASINASSAWDKSENEYILKGTGPTLTIYVDMAAGDFDLLTE